MTNPVGKAALYPVELLKGIGPKLAKQMSKIHLGTVEELASLEWSTLKSIANTVKGLSENQLRGLLSQSQFYLLSEDGAIASAVLVENNIHTYVQLIALPTNRLVNILGEDWDLNRAAQLQLNAARFSLCFQVLFNVVDGNGKPIKSQLQVGGVGFDEGERVVTRDGDAEGWVLSPWLRRDRSHHLSIVAGSERRSLFVRSSPPQVKRFTVKFGQQPRGFDEAKSNPITRLLSGKETVIVEKIALSALAPGTPLKIARQKDRTANLLSLYRNITGNAVITYRIDVDVSTLPDETQPNSLLLVDGDGNLRLATPQEKTNIIANREFKFLNRQ